MASPYRRMLSLTVRRKSRRQFPLTPHQLDQALRELCARGLLEKITEQGGTVRYRVLPKGRS
jgi:DNA-binding HxlR family transcriptional regulator